MVIMKLNDAGVCFVCGKSNKYGLKLNYRIENRKFLAELSLDKKFVGFKDIIHGGILASLLDEAMGNLAFKLGYNCVSVNLNINLRHFVKPNEKLFLKGEILGEEGKKIRAKSEIRNDKDEVMADATGLLIKI